MGTRQEATSEAKDHLITEVNEVYIGTEVTAFVFTAPPLEGEPEVQCLVWCTTSHPVPLQYSSDQKRSGDMWSNIYNMQYSNTVQCAYC